MELLLQNIGWAFFIVTFIGGTYACIRLIRAETTILELKDECERANDHIMEKTNTAELYENEAVKLHETVTSLEAEIKDIERERDMLKSRLSRPKLNKR